MYLGVLINSEELLVERLKIKVEEDGDFSFQKCFFASLFQSMVLAVTTRFSPLTTN